MYTSAIHGIASLCDDSAGLGGKPLVYVNVNFSYTLPTTSSLLTRYGHKEKDLLEHW